MTVGERIKKIRLEKGMTQKEVAEKSGMFDSALRRIENGKQNPKIETIEKIANALEVDPGQLSFGCSKILEHSKEMHNDYVKHPEKYTVEISKDGKQYFYINTNRADIIKKYDSLNTLGQQKALDYVTDLSEQEKYTKPDEEG